MKRFKLRKVIVDGWVKPGHDGGGCWNAVGYKGSGTAANVAK
jgi:hypothetical protein